MSVDLEIGVTSWKPRTGCGVEDIWRQAEQAESLGIGSFWLPENHFGDDRSMPSPLMLLAAVASRTTTIKLGTVSYLLPIRSPLLAAEEVAVLDQLSAGRVILGVGRGIQDVMFRAFELPNTEKRKIFAHNLEVMRNAWAGLPVAHDDKGLPITLAPLPAQKDGPPIWVAAFGPLALKQVGGLGLPYLASPVESLVSLEANYRAHHEAVTAAGHESVSTVPVMRTVYVSDNAKERQGLKTRLAEVAPPVKGVGGDSIDDWTIIGDSHYVVDKLKEYQASLGMTHLIASGRLPGVAGDEVLRSHEYLLRCL
jgi:alkanesulfonate monooxygenase SsuD/methylene tetrahydromethanopterin reductase-like flavin-dependent oxidoreductase (luciferase family)